MVARSVSPKQSPPVRLPEGCMPEGRCAWLAKSDARGFRGLTKGVLTRNFPIPPTAAFDCDPSEIESITASQIEKFAWILRRYYF